MQTINQKYTAMCKIEFTKEINGKGTVKFIGQFYHTKPASCFAINKAGKKVQISEASFNKYRALP